jgi:hypothetical protein
MGVTLSISISSPLEPADRELLTGLSIMTLAIANHELAKERFPGTFPDEDPDEDPPKDCGAPDGMGKACISPVGHMGRHRFRPLAGSSGVN